MLPYLLAPTVKQSLATTHIICSPFSTVFPSLPIPAHPIIPLEPTDKEKGRKYANHVLPARVKPSGLRHARPLLDLRADAEEDGADAEERRARDGRVRFPVRGLAVPAAGWGPDVLGVPIQFLQLAFFGCAKWRE